MRISLKVQRKRVDQFLKDHPNVVLNPDRDNDHFMLITAQGGGGCPCDPRRKSCPCDQAEKEIKKKGQCLCGLFKKKPKRRKHRK
jgi:ferredoxin-thioredoxin reductase catalytic subunit